MQSNVRLYRWMVFGSHGETFDSWAWCLHCQRCYQFKDVRYKSGLELCAYEDCRGDTVMDAVNWETHRRVMAYDYPERDWLPQVPEVGVVYALSEEFS